MHKGKGKVMDVSKDELLHIAKLADLNLKDEEVDNYLENLKNILNFAAVINNAPVENLSKETNDEESFNVFRKDEVKIFENHEGLMQNAPEQERGMFKIPKVIQ